MLAWLLCGIKGIRTSTAKKPYIIVIFQGGGSGPRPPSGSAHESHNMLAIFAHATCYIALKYSQNVSVLQYKLVAEARESF